MSTTTQSASSHTLALPWVKHVTEGFVFCDDMRVAVSLALAAGVNLIFSGPGGHGKSEFLETVFGAIAGQETYVKSFGQGTSTEELFGGLDFDALNRTEGAALQFNPELSFLNFPIAIFEELFDAPPRVLTSLKDTLTARELRNGHQRYSMETRVIAAATNHSPQEIAEGGREIEALIQRFPIQLEVKWSAYDKGAFTKLFATVLDRGEAGSVTSWAEIEVLQQQAKAATVSSGIQSLMAQVLVELIKDKVSISPRTAMMALQLAKAAAAINGRQHVLPADLKAIAFLPGALHLRQRIDELIVELAGSIEAEEKLNQVEQELTRLVERFNTTDGTEELESLAIEADRLAASISVLRVSSDQLDRRRTLHRSATSLAVEARDSKSLAELNRLETTLMNLQGRLGRDTVAECKRVCSDIRHVIEDAMTLPTRGVHANDRVNKLINEAQALLQVADDELRKAQLEAGYDQHIQRLEEISTWIDQINRQLSKSLSPQDRRELMGEVGTIESELSEMLVHPDLVSTRDALSSKIMVLRLKAVGR